MAQNGQTKVRSEVFLSVLFYYSIISGTKPIKNIMVFFVPKIAFKYPLEKIY